MSKLIICLTMIVSWCYSLDKYNNKFMKTTICEQIYELKVRQFSELPKDLLDSIGNMGIDNSLILNEYEGRFLNYIFDIDTLNINLIGKKVGFYNPNLKGGKGKYFQETRERLNQCYSVIGGSVLYIFNDIQKEESGGYEAAVVYWSKFLIPIDKVAEILKDS